MSNGRLAVALGAGAVAAGTVVSLLRQGGPGALNTVWAEDGQIFLTEAVGKRLDAFATSYAGYFHAIPRLLAALVSLLPAEWAAVALAMSAALVTAVFAVSVFVLSAEWLPSRLARVIISAPVVALPFSQYDLPNSIANLHWTGLYLLFWLLLCRPATHRRRGGEACGAAACRRSWRLRRRGGEACGAAACRRSWRLGGQILAVLGILLIVGSDILAGTYLPLVAFLVWFHGGAKDAAKRRFRKLQRRGRGDRYTTVKGAAFGLALAGQVAGLLTGASERAGLEPNPARWLTGYVLRAVPSTLLGQRWVGLTVTKTTLVFAAVAWLVVVAALVLAWRRRTDPQWTLAGLAGSHSLALYAAPVALSGVATPRYAVAPGMLLLVALVALLRPKKGQAPSGAAVPLRALALLVLLVVAVNLRVDNPRAHGPAWDAQLREARQACADGGESIEVPIPSREPPWHATLRCDYIRAS